MITGVNMSSQAKNVTLPVLFFGNNKVMKCISKSFIILKEISKLVLNNKYTLSEPVLPEGLGHGSGTAGCPGNRGASHCGKEG
jgi:hypothetical protein